MRDTMLRVSRWLLAVLLVIGVAGSILFGGFLHAVVPHDHDNEMIWSLLHAAVRAAEKYIVILPFFCAYALVRLAVARPLIAFAIPRGKSDAALCRGIVAYRRFG